MSDTTFDMRTLVRRGAWISVVIAAIAAIYFLSSSRSSLATEARTVLIAQAHDTDALCPLSQKEKKDVFFIGCGGFI